jgi:hypothetical protein
MLNEVSIGQSVQLDVFEQFIRAHAEVKQATEAS